MDKYIDLDIINGQSAVDGMDAAAATVRLPTTPEQICDALEQAGALDDQIGYTLTIIDCEPINLEQILPLTASIHALNAFAHALGQLSDWQVDAFEGLALMDAKKSDFQPISVERLLQLAASVDSCNIAYDVHDDAQLGRFYAENDFIPELENLPDEVFRWLDYKKIGKTLREGEGGVFTPAGYVVLNGALAEIEAPAVFPETQDVDQYLDSNGPELKM